MFNFLKQSTASQSKTVGPFVDDTDFKTAETGLSIANTDVKLSKNGAAGVNKNSGGGTHRNNGMYSLTFDATDTDTVGELEGSIAISGALIVTFKFMVIEEDIYDALFGASAAGFNSSGLVTLAGVTHTNAVIPTISALTGHTVQTGDSFARLGAPAGASIAEDLSVIEGRIPAALVSGRMISDIQALEGETGASARLSRLFSGGQHGTASAGTSSSITLNGSADSNDDFFNGSIIVLSNGAGKKQHRLIIDYNGTTKVATISPNWVVNPDSSTDYVVIALGLADTVAMTGSTVLDAISDAVLDEVLSGHVSVGSLGKVIAEILIDTAEIGTAGVALTNLGGMSTGMKAEVNAEVDTGISDASLATATNLALVDTVVDNILARTLTAADIAKLSASVGTIVSAVVETGTLSSTQMTSDLSEATNDHYIGRIILWTSGPLTNQATDITDYVGASGLLTFTEVTDVPVNGNTFIIV